VAEAHDLKSSALRERERERERESFGGTQETDGREHTYSGSACEQTDHQAHHKQNCIGNRMHQSYHRPCPTLLAGSRGSIQEQNTVVGFQSEVIFV